jgi:predicted anti-sigma-YlaC factor YlaD
MNSANQHIPEDDLALFALALMPPEEAAFTQAHLKHCDQCRGEVARMQGDLVAYAFSAEMQDPPPPARARLLDAVAKEKRLHIPAAPAVEPVIAPRASNLLDRDLREERPVRRSLSVFGWAGWALAASLAAVAGWEFYQGQYLREQIASQGATLTQVNGDAARAQRVLQALTDPTAMQVALHLPTTGTATPKPEGHASYNAQRGELVFIASHLQPVQPDKTYELWVLPASGETPVAAGLFKPDVNGNASVVLPDIPKHIAAKGFGVTLENDGGSRTPTLPILLMGT